MSVASRLQDGDVSFWVSVAVFRGAILAPGVPLTSQQQFSEVLSSRLGVTPAAVY